MSAIHYPSYIADAVSQGHISLALKDIRQTLAQYRATFPDKAAEVSNITTPVVMLASRYQDLETAESKKIIDRDDAVLERANITHAILNIINDWSADLVTFAGALSHEPLPEPEAIPEIATPFIRAEKVDWEQSTDPDALVQLSGKQRKMVTIVVAIVFGLGMLYGIFQEVILPLFE